MNIFKIALIIGIFLISYSLFVAYPIYRAIKISEQMIARVKPYEQHPLVPKQTILVTGDSTAVGVGALDNQESIAGRLGQQFPQADITNLGVSGARLKDLIPILKSQKESFKTYDLLMIQIGANDITHFTPYATIHEQLLEVIALAEQLSKKTLILTCGNMGGARVFRWPLSFIMRERTLKVRTLFQQVISNRVKVFYIDLFKDKKNDPFEKDLKKYYAPDLFHLTGAGYGIWYLAVAKQL